MSVRDNKRQFSPLSFLLSSAKGYKFRQEAQKFLWMSSVIYILFCACAFNLDSGFLAKINFVVRYGNNTCYNPLRDHKEYVCSHYLPICRHRQPAVWANLSARVCVCACVRAGLWIRLNWFFAVATARCVLTVREGEKYLLSDGNCKHEVFWKVVAES